MAKVIFRPFSCGKRINEVHKERSCKDDEWRDSLLKEESVVFDSAIFFQLFWSGYDSIRDRFMDLVIHSLRENFGDGSDKNADESKEQEDDEENDEEDEKEPLIVFA